MKLLNTLKQSIFSLVVGASLLSQTTAQVVAQEAAAINAPLTAEQKAYVIKNAPILIQVDFTHGYDNVVPFNFANPNEMAFKLGNVEAQRDILDEGTSIPATQAIVDWDYIEVGGAVSLNFMFFRPLSSAWPTDRRADTESAVLIAKKNKVGPVSTVGFPDRINQIFGNAHGDGISAACDDASGKCLVDISKSAKLKDYTRNQANKSILQLVDGRTALVSEYYTHAMVPLTDMAQLQKDITVKNAVVYYPAGADVAEMRKFMSGATFVPYNLRDQELSSILIANKDKILGGESKMNYTGQVESFAGTPVKLVDGLPSELRDDAGKASGANGYWGWAPAPVQTKNDGSRHIPKKRQDGADGQDRPHAPALHILLGKALYQYFTADEIAAGAVKPVRNGFMVDVK